VYDAAPGSPYARTVEGRVGPRDVVLPVILLAVGTAELASLGTPGWVAAAGLEALAALALVWRRPLPMIAVPASAIALMGISSTGTESNEAAAPILFYVLGMYSLGRFASWRGGLVGAALTLALVFVDISSVEGGADWTDVMFVLSLAVPPYLFGRITRRLAEQSAQLARQAELLRDQAVRDERDRIARELHDVVAHSISAMVVQTAAAQDLVRGSPDRALALLESVAETGRRALGETGRLLHLIRDDSDELGLRPAPGLADVPALVEQFRTAGLSIDASLATPQPPPSGGIDVSAYRVVQEALTNALKYGDGAARLCVEQTEQGLRIACSNRFGPAGTGGSGLGLTGMAERVALLGGSLRHGRAQDRFEVEAVIPL
jgi:signal transduction histidine kinase